MLLTLCMVISMFPCFVFTAAAEDMAVNRADLAVIICNWLGLTDTGTENYFGDIDDCTKEQKDAINSLAAAGLINGTADGQYRPTDAETRIAAVVLICKALGGPDENTVSRSDWFTDIPEDFTAHIDYLAAEGIITPNDELEENRFMPDTAITEEVLTLWINRAESGGAEFSRADLAVLVAEWLKLSYTGTEPYFNDISTCTEQEQNSINALAEAGIISGSQDGKFDPKACSTRSDAAIIIYRAWVYYGGGTSDEAQTIFSDMTEENVNAYLAGIFNTLVYQGILTADDAIDGKFLPDQLATTATVSTWLSRVSRPQDTPGILRLTLLTPAGMTINDGYTVNWYKDGTLLGSGTSITVTDRTADYHYEIILSDVLAEQYSIVNSGTVQPNGALTEITVSLEALPSVIVTGVVTASDGTTVSGAEFAFTQYYTPSLSKTVTGTTEHNGSFSVEIKNVSSVLTISAEGYMNASAAIPVQTGSTLDLGTLVLHELPQRRVELSLSMAHAVASGETARVTSLTSFSGLEFEIYNNTEQSALNSADFTVQYPYILFHNGVSAGDNLTITVHDATGRLVSGYVTMELDGNGMGSAGLSLTENGSFAISSFGGVEQTSLLLLPSGSDMPCLAATAGLAYSSTALPAGSYQLILIEKSDLIGTVSSLDTLTELGLSAPADYTVMDITISAGVITELDAVSVPRIDESRLSWTVPDSTGTTVDRYTVTTGRYVTLRIEYQAKAQLANSITRASVAVQLPEGIELIGPVTVDGKAVAYTASGNIVTIPVDKASGIIRAFVVASQSGKYHISPRLSLTTASASVLQPVGTAIINVTDSQIYAPSITSHSSILVSGLTVANGTVQVYDNGISVGSTTADVTGKWSLTYGLDNNGQKYYTHEIYAQITIDGFSDTIETETMTLIYDMAHVDISCVRMYNYLSGGLNETVFDYKNPLSGSGFYTVIDEEFTFAIEFEDVNEINRVQSVYLNVFAEDGEVYTLDTVYDSAAKRYTASVSGIVPVNVGVEYICTSPEGFDYCVECSPDVLREAMRDFSADVDAEITEQFEIKQLKEWHDALAITFGTADSSEDEWFTVHVHVLDHTKYSEEVLKANEFWQLEGENLFCHISVTGDAIQQIFVNTESDEEWAFATTLYRDTTSIVDSAADNEALISMYRTLFADELSSEPSVLFEPFPYEITRSGKYSEEFLSQKFEEAADFLFDVPGKTSLLTIWYTINIREFILCKHETIEKYITILKERIQYLKELKDCDGNSVVTESEILTAETMLDSIIKNEETRLEYWRETQRDVYKKKGMECLKAELSVTAMDEWWKYYFRKLGRKIGIGLGKTSEEIEKITERLEDALEKYDDTVNWYDNLADDVGIDFDPLHVPTFSNLLEELTYPDPNEWFNGARNAYDVDAVKEIKELEDYIFSLIDDPNPCMPKLQPVSPKDKEKSPCEDQDVIRDPSGYVYEAVASNRLEDVKTTIYYKSSDAAEPVIWNAAAYRQDNPLFTDAEGMYHWDVPEGLWQVRCEKDGYTTSVSDWLTVPPPQTDINIAMISTAQPVVEQVLAYTDRVELVFSQYMDIESVKAAVGLSVGRNTADCTVTALDGAYDPTGTVQYATRFAVVPNSPADLSAAVSITVAATSKNYAGNTMSEAYASPDLTPTPRPTGIDTSETMYVQLGVQSSLRAVLLPGIQGQSLKVTSLTPQLLAVDSSTAEVTTDAEGAARIILTGLMPGVGRLEITEPDSGLSVIVRVEISVTAPQEGVPEAVTATLADGTVVTDGTRLPVGTKIILATATEGATIRYTVNGVCPRKAGALIYSEPITITEDTQLQAVALKDGIFSEVIQIEIKVTDGIAYYTATVVDGGERSYGSGIYPVGEVVNISAGSREGYDFTGWTAAGVTLSNPYRKDISFIMPENDVILKANWTYSGGYTPPTSVYCTLTFDTNGGTKINSITRISGTTVDLTQYITEKDGYAFAGWYADAELTESITSIHLTGDKTVFAGWEKIETDAVTNPFTDVSKSDWFYEAVLYVAENGLMNGTGNSQFSPYITTSRGMIVTILYRLENEPAVWSSCPFDDVTPGSYYEDAITWAAANGIVNGYGKDFGPDDAITREQLAAILWRYAKYKDYDVSVGENTNILSYNDASDVAEYAVPAIQWACGAGIIQGDNGNLMPQGSALRSQAAAILQRFCENVVK